MIVAVVVEVLVAGLERPPVVRILVWLEAVLAEQHAVLVLHEEVVRRLRLAAELGENGRHLEVDVRHRVEHLLRLHQIVGAIGEVRADVGGLRMLAEHAIALGEQLLEARELPRRIAAIA